MNILITLNKFIKNILPKIKINLNNINSEHNRINGHKYSILDYQNMCDNEKNNKKRKINEYNVI